MKDFIIFTHGVYKAEHLSFYRKLCRSRIKIAVDGGLKFFLRAHIVPNLLIGDLDSLKKIPQDLPRRVKLLTFPANKDRTDLQLAFEYCLKEKAKSIDIIVPSIGEPDHFLGNVMLVNLLSTAGHACSLSRLRFINLRYEMIFVQNRSERFVNCVSDIVSVIPLSRSIKLTCSGTEYEVRDVEIQTGHTRGLRNKILSPQASFDIAGKALIIHRTG